MKLNSPAEYILKFFIDLSKSLSFMQLFYQTNSHFLRIKNKKHGRLRAVILSFEEWDVQELVRRLLSEELRDIPVFMWRFDYGPINHPDYNEFFLYIMYFITIMCCKIITIMCRITITMICCVIVNYNKKFWTFRLYAKTGVNISDFDDVCIDRSFYMYTVN